LEGVTLTGRRVNMRMHVRVVCTRKGVTRRDPVTVIISAGGLFAVLVGT